MIQVPIEKRSLLKFLIQNHVRQRVIIDAIIENPYGTVFTDTETSPNIARFQLGAFKIFAGDPDHPQAETYITTCPAGLVIPETEAWKNRILNFIGENCTTYLRTGFSFDHLNVEHVQQFANTIPKGYRIEPLNIELAKQECRQTAYANAKTLLQNGVGYFALYGNQIAAGALAYTNSNHGIEIQIYTYGEHRRRGLATCTSATLLAYCLKHNIKPHWSAANAVSANLANKLGYVQNDQYDAIIHKPAENRT